jgi:hypothetical protein
MRRETDGVVGPIDVQRLARLRAARASLDPNQKGILSMRTIRTASFAALAAAAALLSAAPQARAANVVVNSLSLSGWFGGNEGPGGSVGTVDFVPGPGTPPLGGGSAELTVDSNGRASFGTAQYKGTALTAITQLTYAAWVATAAHPESPSVQFDMDYDKNDNNTAYQGRLVFVPPLPTLDTWTAFDALAGTWWATAAPGNLTCSQASPCTWNQVLAAFPNAAIRNDPNAGGNLLFRLGGPVTGGSRVDVDDFTITAGPISTTWDFEPGVSANPSVIAAGGLITVRAYGFKPNKTVKSSYYVNGTSGKRVLLCSATSSETGAFLCTVPLPTGALAGPSGIHAILIQGLSRVKYTTQIFITP